MGFPLPAQASYQAGMRQDEPRGQMVSGSVWNLVDFIPDIDDAPLAKRGGWTYGSDTLSGTWAAAAAFANFSGGAKLCAIDNAGGLSTVNTSTNAASAIGTAVAPLQNPVLHADKLIIPASDGTTAPKYYDGTTLADLAGSPPAGKFAAVYKDRTVLANTTANKTFAYFSAAATPTTWDTTNGYLSVLAPVTGMAALPNALLLFQATACARIRGSNPPPGSDMIIDDPIFNVGCTDARSIIVSGGFCVFANPLGVYVSNGTSQPEDLTATAGLKRYWRNKLASYSAASWTLAGGLFQNKYIITVMNGSSFIDCLTFDLTARCAYRFANVPADCYTSAVTVQEELYFGSRSEARLGKISPMYVPASATKTDANGTAVTPVLETPMYSSWRRIRRTWRPATGKARWDYFYLGYDMRDAATDDPVLTVSTLKTPEGSYTALSQTLTESADYTRTRIPLRFLSEACAFKIAQTNASSNTRLYTIENDTHVREASRP